MFRWCRVALTALVATILAQGSTKAASEERVDLEARLEALREQRESRLAGHRDLDLVGHVQAAAAFPLLLGHEDTGDVPQTGLLGFGEP